MVPKNCSIPECENVHHGRGMCSMHYQRWDKTGSANPAPASQRNLAKRFWSKVDKSGDCWEWIAGKGAGGYGSFQLDGRDQKAHRVSYAFAKGEIDRGVELDHRCHNRGCVNPDHLRPVTRKQNMENLSGPISGSASGVRGVHWSGQHRKWRGSVGHNYKTFHVGLFPTIDEAEAAVIAKRLELFTHNDLDRIKI